MADVWVKLLTMQSISHHGTMKTYYPDDWVEIGKHLARQLVANGSAEILRADVKTDTFDFADCGVVLLDGEYNPYREAKLKLDVKRAPPFLQFDKNMIYDGSFKRANQGLVPVGFKLLDQRSDTESKPWQIAAPIHSYQELACDIGTDEDRALTSKIVPDLRCMVFEPRFMFVRRCPDTQRLMHVWQQERKKGKDEKLAFFRAVYKVKPLILHLPVTWIGVKW